MTNRHTDIRDAQLAIWCREIRRQTETTRNDLRQTMARCRECGEEIASRTARNVRESLELLRRLP